MRIHDFGLYPVPAHRAGRAAGDRLQARRDCADVDDHVVPLRRAVGGPAEGRARRAGDHRRPARHVAARRHPGQSPHRLPGLRRGRVHLPGLPARLEAGDHRWDQIQGLWYKEDGKIIPGGSRKPIEDLDTLPYPSRHLFELDKYPLYAPNGEPMLTILSSRGCPYDCSFCFKGIVGRSYHQRSPENIVAELQAGVRHLPHPQLLLHRRPVHHRREAAGEDPGLLHRPEAGLPLALPGAGRPGHAGAC